MCKILLSINPEYVSKIFSGEKMYEFRKILAKRHPEKIIIYCTSPISAIVGEADIETILIDTPQNVRHMTRDVGGVEDTFFFSYFGSLST